MNVVVIVTFFSSLHLIHIQFNLVQAQTHTREKKRVRAFNAGLIYEIALFQLYAVIWVCQCIELFWIERMRETTKKIQFYLSSFTIHEAMVSLFFGDLSLNLSLVNVKYARHMRNERNKLSKASEWTKGRKKTESHTSLDRSGQLIAVARNRKCAHDQSKKMIMIFSAHNKYAPDRGD